MLFSIVKYASIAYATNYVEKAMASASCFSFTGLLYLSKHFIESLVGETQDFIFVYAFRTLPENGKTNNAHDRITHQRYFKGFPAF